MFDLFVPLRLLLLYSMYFLDVDNALSQLPPYDEQSFKFQVFPLLALRGSNSTQNVVVVSRLVNSESKHPVRVVRIEGCGKERIVFSLRVLDFAWDGRKWKKPPDSNRAAKRGSARQMPWKSILVRDTPASASLPSTISAAPPHPKQRIR
jgi:hypothetical protein